MNLMLSKRTLLGTSAGLLAGAVGLRYRERVNRSQWSRFT